jgi:hypothetical protein
MAKLFLFSKHFSNPEGKKVIVIVNHYQRKKPTVFLEGRRKNDKKDTLL